jgi:drug/metabolite transporter (DMT)-like permease
MNVRREYKAIGAAISAAASNTVMATLTKNEVEGKIAPHLVLFWRSCFAIAILILLMLLFQPHENFWSQIKTKRLWMHFTRAFFGLAGSFIYFYMLKVASLTLATLLFFTVPLFMPLVAFFWRGDRLPHLSWIGLLIGFLGVICVIKPGHQLFHFSSLFGLCSGLFIAIGQFASYLLTKTESNHRINFYYFLFSLLITLPLIFTPNSGLYHIQPLDYFFFFWIGIFALVYLLLITLALKHGPPPLVTCFLFTVVIFSMLVDWFVWKIIAHWLTWLGAVLIVMGVLLMFYFHRLEPEKANGEKKQY